MVRVSKKLRLAVKTSPHKDYKIANAARMHPSTLSQIINGIIRVHENDDRVIRIGKVLGLKPEECFEKERR